MERAAGVSDATIMDRLRTYGDMAALRLADAMKEAIEEAVRRSMTSGK